MIVMQVKRLVARVLQRWCPRVWLGVRIARRDRHFEPEFWLIPFLCDRQHVAIDIGANMGEFAFLMARHAERVVAFEPNRDLWPALRRLLGNGVRLESAALSSAPGNASFRYLEDNTGVATVETRNPLSMIGNHAEIRTRTVELRTLDSFDLDRVSFIKIDVEGHEEAVIEGAIETLRRNRPSLLIESEDRHNKGAPGRLAARLAVLGYCGLYLSGGRLVDLETITDGERDFGNLSGGGMGYINNYIFIPTERTDLISSLKAIKSFRGTGGQVGSGVVSGRGRRW
jgi:FkbM family methyltransferase